MKISIQITRRPRRPKGVRLRTMDSILDLTPVYSEFRDGVHFWRVDLTTDQMMDHVNGLATLEVDRMPPHTSLGVSNRADPEKRGFRYSD